MNHRRLLLCGVAALAGWTAPSASAQAPATTLDQLARGATHVGVYRVSAVRKHVRSARLLVGLQLAETLFGTPPEQLLRSESERVACGCALHGLQVGDRLIAFLNGSDPAGPLAGGERGMPRATPARIAHVQSLLAARDAGGTRRAVLIDALQSDDERITTDAALALPLQPGLEAAPASDRMRIRSATSRALGAADGNQVRTYALLRATARDPARAATAVLLDGALATQGNRNATAAAQSLLLKRPLDQVHAELAARLPALDTEQLQRALALTVRKDPAESRALTRLLWNDKTASRSSAQNLGRHDVRLQAAALWVRDGGAGAALRGRFTAEEIQRVRAAAASNPARRGPRYVDRRDLR